MFIKTRRECLPAGSVAASLLLTVLANTSAFYTKRSRLALGLAQWSNYLLSGFNFKEVSATYEVF